MRRHIVGIIAAGLLLAGCSGESGGDKAEPKATAEAAAGTGWVARAVPAPAKAPAEEGRGTVVR